MIFGPQAKQKSVEFKATVQRVEVGESVMSVDQLPEVPRLIGDERRIKQILMNLVRNALKFTEQGFIYLAVSYSHWPENLLTIEVKDSGVGIAPEEMPKLFTRFGKLLRTASINHEGIGLGLNIVN